MLRMSYLPSDFHPLLLVLGDHAALKRFADLLAAFGRTGVPVRLAGEGGVFSTDTEVLLKAAGASERPGLWPDPGRAGALAWTLSPGQTATFASDVSELATSEAAAGSVTLECGVLNEIRVKVSIGEWEDGFLMDEVR